METAEIIKIDYKAIKYPVAEKAISKMIAEYTSLTIEGVEDRQGYMAVDAARKDLKSKRVAIEHKRKDLNEDARKYINAVNGEAKRLTDMITPVESRLKDMTDEIDAEKQRIKKEKEEAEMKKLMDRLNRLSGINHGQNSESIMEMDDEGFELFFEAAKALHDAEMKKIQEQERIRKEEEAKAEAERLAEQKRIEAEKAAMEAERKKMEAERMALEEEKRKMQAEKDRIQREKELEEAKKIAAEEAKKAEQERIRLQEEEKKRLEAEEIERKKREEALKPDKEKIESYLEALLSVSPPALKNKDSIHFLESIVQELGTLTSKYRKQISNI